MYKEKRRVSSELRPDLGGCREWGEGLRFKRAASQGKWHLSDVQDERTEVQDPEWKEP